MQALAQQQQQNMQFAQPQKTATLFVGSISGGITDPFLNQLLGVCFAYNFSHKIAYNVVYFRRVALSFLSNVLLLLL